MTEKKRDEANKVKKPSEKQAKSKVVVSKKSAPRGKSALTEADSGQSQTQKPNKNPENQKGFLEETVENIETGAKVIGEMTADIAGTIFDKLKLGFSEAFESGSKTVTTVKNSAQDYIEKYKNKAEINNMRDAQEENYKKLGSMLYQKYKIESKPLGKMEKDSDIAELLKNIAMKEKEIIKLGKLLDKSNN